MNYVRARKDRNRHFLSLQVETDLNKAYLKYFIGRFAKFVSDGSDFEFALGADNGSTEKKTFKNIVRACRTFFFGPTQREENLKILSKELQNNPLLNQGWKEAQTFSTFKDPEFLALYVYTLENPDVYVEFNKETRTIGPGTPNYNFNALYFFMSEGLQSIPVEKCVVYRGVTHPVTTTLGSKFTFNCFTSTSKFPSVAHDFLNKRGNTHHKTLFIIETDNGRDISKYSAYKTEAEVLISPCEEFEVVMIYYTNNGIQVIHLKSS